MNVSYKWLSEYIDLNGYTGDQLAELMTSGGIEIDVVESRNKGVTGVVVGHVLTREKHPDADKLSVCTVDVGEASRCKSFAAQRMSLPDCLFRLLSLARSCLVTLQSNARSFAALNRKG